MSRARDLSRLAVLARPWAVVALLTLVALLLRRYHLGSESLWFDEADIVQRARQSLPALLQSFTKAGENGPLYTLLLHFYLSAIDAVPALQRLLHLLFGPNPEALVRGLSAVFGAGAIPLIYLLGKRAGGVATGLVAAALFTFNPFHIWHSQDAKMYTFLVLMTLASSLLYLEAFRRNTPALWLGYVISTWVMLTVHSMAALVLLAQLAATPFLFGVGTWARSSVRTFNAASKARLVRWAWAMLLMLIPIFPIAWLRLAALVVGTDVGGWYTPTGLTDILSTIFVTFAVNRAPAPWETVGALVMGMLALVGVVGMTRDKYESGAPVGNEDVLAAGTQHSGTQRVSGTEHLAGRPLVLSLWIVPIFAFWLVTLKLPLFQPRYLIMSLPPYLILAASGVVALVSRAPAWLARLSSNSTLKTQHSKLGSVLTVIAALALALPTGAALAAVNYSPQAQKEDWRGAVAYVQDHLRLRDVIVVFPGYLITGLNYYYRPGGPAKVPQVDVKTIASLRTEGFGDVQLNAALRDAVTCHERAWLITSPIRQLQEDPGNRVQQWFQYNWHTFDTRVFNGITVYGLSFNGQPNCWYPEPDHKERHDFANGLDFLGYIYELRGSAPSQPDASYFPLTLYWRNERQMNHDYIVRVVIKDLSGKAVVGEALGPLNGYWPTTQWPPGTQVIDYRDLRLPGGLTPGDYTVSLQVYPNGLPDQPLKLREGGGTEIVLKDPLHVVPWKP